MKHYEKASKNLEETIKAKNPSQTPVEVKQDQSEVER